MAVLRGGDYVPAMRTFAQPASRQSTTVRKETSVETWLPGFPMVQHFCRYCGNVPHAE